MTADDLLTKSVPTADESNMQTEPIITFHGVRPSAGLERELFRRAKKLETYYAPITSCQVLVEFSEKRHGAGNRYRVRIDLSVPGKRILVTHEANQRARARALGLSKLARLDEPERAHRYARVTIHDAFDVARRRLQDYARRQRGAVKLHRTRPSARPLAVS